MDVAVFRQSKHQSLSHGSVALTCDDRAEVDTLVDRAIEAPDGHIWEIVWMDPSAIQEQ